jgi:hypothetical protein
MFEGVIKFARSATRHRVSKERSRYVLEHCGWRFKESPPSSHTEVLDLRLVYLGDDAEGARLEVIAVETGKDELLVIHAMPLRTKYKPQYEEARKWRL